MVLSGLTALAFALLSVGALEPQISRNHADMVRARYLAEAGIEHAYDVLAVNAGAWDAYLNGSTCAAGSVLVDAPLPGRAASEGRFRVFVRNDCGPGDERLTGVARESGVDDTNGKLVIVSTGIFGHITHTITATVSDDSVLDATSQTVATASVRTYNWSDQ
jgi:Tfp pilus assembly protein PilX